MSAPIKQCELELGRPNHQVPIFQNRAAMNSETSIATAGPPSGGVSTSAGNNSTSAYATAIPPTRTPVKFMNPDQTTAATGGKDLV